MKTFNDWVVACDNTRFCTAVGMGKDGGAGGAIVVGIGHGRSSVAAAMAEQAARVAYAHGSAFTTEPLERYAETVGRLLPLDDPAIYPVSGGSEAIETALKLARAVQLARGEADRTVVLARWSSYHGNTLGALDLSGREPLRAAREPSTPLLLPAAVVVLLPVREVAALGLPLRPQLVGLGQPERFRQAAGERRVEHSVPP